MKRGSGRGRAGGETRQKMREVLNEMENEQMNLISSSNVFLHSVATRWRVCQVSDFFCSVLSISQRGSEKIRLSDQSEEGSESETPRKQKLQLLVPTALTASFDV